MPTVDTDVRIEVAGEVVELQPEMALFWPERSALVVADVHIGKPAAFRSSGIPLPPGTTASDLGRLSASLDRTGAVTLYVLGDLYHAESGRDPNTMHRLATWRENHSALDVHVILGNHDRRTQIAAGEFGFAVYADPLRVGPFVLCHEPETFDGGYALCGHVHPAVMLRGGRESVRLPCFLFRPRYGVLPSFGEFTGHGVISPEKADRIFVVADGQVIKVS